MSLLSQYGHKFSSVLNSKPVKLSLLVGLMVIVRSTFAEDSLAGATDIVKEAYNGSIKTYLYVGEAVAAIMTLIFTRNIKALGGVGAMAIFMNVVAVLAGF